MKITMDGKYTTRDERKALAERLRKRAASSMELTADMRQDFYDVSDAAFVALPPTPSRN